MSVFFSSSPSSVTPAAPFEPEKRIASRGKEPSRRKTHWDYLLEEMAWLAKDFESERKMKLTQAKKLAVKVCKSGLSTESKGLRRQKEEEQRMRRLASNIAKDVKKFWTKIEKLIVYKHQLELEGRRKKALDKHLDFLVGQTERYSTMLAEIWLDTPQADLQPSEEDGKPVQEDQHLQEPSASGGITTSKRAMQTHDASPSTPGQISNADVDMQEEETKSQSDDANGEEQEHCHIESESIGRARTRSKMMKVEEDGEFFVGNAEDVEDDFSTLEADEALITEVERREELLALEREGSLPLEELLKMYSSRREEEEGVEEEEKDEEQGDDKVGMVDEEEEQVEEKVLDEASAPVNANGGMEKQPCTQAIAQNGVEEEGFNKLEEGDDAAYNNVNAAAAAAQSAQPTGFTFSTTKVRTKLPFLLKHSLREYQHIGLDWLVTMYERRLNGILADEMGLGKTIMTISLLAHLACEKGIWGPHLIVVPTSVMLNWETEFMKWSPAFKILTYFGTAKERKVKRQGWSKANSFHVCITTYRLVIQDAKAFKRKKWKYLILDEAHLIKNWKSQRWQTLLNFNSKRRILLTGTPLQNDLMELWSLMHFLMPHIFQSHQQFRDWFNNPITGMVEGQEQINKPLVDRLHNVLRPFILRRLKADVEKQLPKKYEHVIKCRLSKRQRNLYEDFMASSDTQATLSSGNFLGLLNVLMQLRKVCNHPDLFEGRPIISSFDMSGIDLHISSAVASAASDMVELRIWNFVLSQLEFEMSAWEAVEIKKIATPHSLIEELKCSGEDGWSEQEQACRAKGTQESILDDIQESLREARKERNRQRLASFAWLNLLRCSSAPLFGLEFVKQLRIDHPVYDAHKLLANPLRSMEVASLLCDAIQLPSTRCDAMLDLLQAFVFAIPAARAPPPAAWCSHPTSLHPCFIPDLDQGCVEKIRSSTSFLRPILVRTQLFFPDRKLIQFDCGKLQELAVLLRRLRLEGHRALIFTQMTKMLDVLESFVNLHGYTYLRLDGSTKPEERQILMQRFNTNPKIFLFILSTRSGGVGVNLVGADTVIFYDSDWNPAMDLQAQDRCHRIGQTREVHIYRLVSESTIEENILKKANQKRFLDDLVIQGGSYNTEFFKKLDPAELLSGLKGVKAGHQASAIETAGSVQDSMPELSNVEVEAALKIAEDEADYMALKKVEQEEAAENQEFTEEGYPSRMEEDESVDDLEDGKAGGDKGLTSLEAPVMVAKADGDDGAHAFGSKDLVAIDAALNEDMDMLADVKQMAAVAAASGQGNVSFDSQLSPAEKYAMRFLELWDPIINKDAAEVQDNFEEAEWELDQLERLKQAQEAEIDEDNEPLIYESWDTSYADEAYRQQLEALTQQEYEHQLQLEKLEEELQENARDVAEVELQSKWKKTKFKYLKKGAFVLTDDATTVNEDDVSGDFEWQAPQGLFLSPPYEGPSLRKRKSLKLVEEDTLLESHTKRLRRENDDRIYLEEDHEHIREQDSIVMLLDSPSMAGDGATKANEVSIFGMPFKKGIWVKPERERRKDSRAGEKVDPWMSSEDAVFCAIVHEYGGNWLLASDTLFGVPDGGMYRGRYRHPAQCKERFRQLLLKYTSLGSTRDFFNDRYASHGAGNAPLKVREEHVRQLLETVQELPDEEWLLQRHFVAALTSEGLYGRSSKGFRNEIVKLGSSPHGNSFVRLPKVPMGPMNLVEFDRFSSRMGHRNPPSPHLVAAALAQLDTETPFTRGYESSLHEKKETSFQQGKEVLHCQDIEASLQQESEASKDESSPEIGSTSSKTDEVLMDVLEESEKDMCVQVEFLETDVFQPGFPQNVEITIPGLSGSGGIYHWSDPALSKFIRRFYKTLIDQRYRLACRMGAEGRSKAWAAAAETILGVAGAAKLPGSSEKRLIDFGKSSEKKRRLSKGKESHAEETGSQVDTINLAVGAELSRDGRDDGDTCETSVAGAMLGVSLPDQTHESGNDSSGESNERHSNRGSPEVSGDGADTRERLTTTTLDCQGSAALVMERTPDELMPDGCELTRQFSMGDPRKVTFRDPVCVSPVVSCLK